MRFSHDLLWQQDAAGFTKRIDQFLTIASRTTSVRCLCSSIPAGTHSASGLAASTHPWRPQLRLGAGSGGNCARGPKSVSPSKSIRTRSDRKLMPTITASLPGTCGMSLVASAAIPILTRKLKEKDKIALVARFCHGYSSGRERPIRAAPHERRVGCRPFVGQRKSCEVQSIQLRESDIITFHNYSWPESFKKKWSGSNKNTTGR